MILRSYQSQACDAIERDFQSFCSTLVCCPTGTGKSLIFAEAIKRMAGEGGAIVVAHREELLKQAKGTIESHTGLECEFELGDRKASEIFPSPVLLASVQTMCSGRNGSRRMHKFSPYNYGLLVIDEFHHATAASYRAVIDYFKANKDLKVLGVTATPERSDEEALGQICESVAFDYPILQAIKDGWLVPVQQQLIDIQSLDFSHVRTTAGDLNASDLAAVMESERNLYGICDAISREYVEGDKGIMFTVSVKQAEMAADILNRHRTGFARWVSGKTPPDERASIMRDFHEGRFPELVNCNLVSEGVDVPDANKLHQARLTKSKLLYTQQLGRIMRPLPGIVDLSTAQNDTRVRSSEKSETELSSNGGLLTGERHLSSGVTAGETALDFEEGGDGSCAEKPTMTDALRSSNAAPTFDPAARRRHAIALSAKPIATVMDFVGNAGRHKLVHAIDILGGNVTEEVRELAERTATASGRPTPIDEMVMEASMKADAQRRALDAARKAKITARSTYTMRLINPFDAFDIVAPPSRAWDTGKALSEKQRALLRRQSVDPDLLTYSQGKAIISEMFRRFNGKLCTIKQAACLKRFGYDTHDLTMQDASQLLNQLASNGWRRNDVQLCNENQ